MQEGRCWTESLLWTVPKEVLTRLPPGRHCQQDSSWGQLRAGGGDQVTLAEAKVHWCRSACVT